MPCTKMDTDLMMLYNDGHINIAYIWPNLDFYAPKGTLGGI